jgi:hypothetical protein
MNTHTSTSAVTSAAVCATAPTDNGSAYQSTREPQNITPSNQQRGIRESEASSTQTSYNPQYAIYKPNSRGSGGVARFGLSCAKSSVFLEVATQSGERQFDWEKKIVMKWGIPDLGAILSLFQGRETEVKLFHRTEKADTSLTLIRQNSQEVKGRAPYMLSVFRQNNGDATSHRVGVPITHAEAAILETLIQSAIQRILRW